MSILPRIQNIQIFHQESSGASNQINFSSVNGIEPLDQFCQWLVTQGIVDEIKYIREFSSEKEVTRVLKG